jgi:myo-inositol 2-dehydrogenase/D-chiro-inositol 1-dehydrogenase
MPPIALNRRRFLSCSAAAGLALSRGVEADAESGSKPVKVGVIGLGNRGTSLLRTLLELPGVEVVAVGDAEAKHRIRAQGIVEKATGQRPDLYELAARVLERPDLNAVAVALPCDLHASVYVDAIRAGKHLYAEKPIAPTLAECDRVIAESERAPRVVVHVGYQRRSNPRYRDAIAALARGEAGELVSGSATWTSSNGPMNGHGNWLASRERSGDWMIEQAVHVWDVYQWLLGSSPERAVGHGRRDLFARTQPNRDVTDDYAVSLTWANGFQLTFNQSWIVPADENFTGNWQKVVTTEGGIDLATGTLTYRDRSRPRRAFHPGVQPDTKLALQAFLQSVRSREPLPPPITLQEAREATKIGLLARLAVDERRVVSLDELSSLNVS